MQKLAIMNEKGGVGKSALATQLSFYAALKRNLKVLVIDLDQQCNTSKCIENSGLFHVAEITAGALLLNGDSFSASDKPTLIKGDKLLSRLESMGPEKAKEVIGNFYKALSALDPHYDLCVIDTNPSPDVRAMAALCIANYAVSPVQLNQEAIDGVVQLYENIRRVSVYNPELTFMGLLPNMVLNTPFQRANFRDLMQSFGQILLKDGNGRFLSIPHRTAVSEAQSECRPVWTGEKSTALKTWTEIKGVFEAILEKMKMAEQDQGEAQ